MFENKRGLLVSSVGEWPFDPHDTETVRVLQFGFAVGGSSKIFFQADIPFQGHKAEAYTV